MILYEKMNTETSKILQKTESEVPKMDSKLSPNKTPKRKIKNGTDKVAKNNAKSVGTDNQNNLSAKDMAKITKKRQKN